MIRNSMAKLCIHCSKAFHSVSEFTCSRECKLAIFDRLLTKSKLERQDLFALLA